ncbi:hypothetical protein [Nocardia sp. GAS34]|uniref:hypothetical protein n=1 Tax=unclassified Nocardia TaxID=2637762 RepID=UPI003D1BB0F5
MNATARQFGMAGTHFSDPSGIETGSTDAAGTCLLFEAVRAGRPLIGVVLHSSPDDGAVAEHMLDWGYRAAFPLLSAFPSAGRSPYPRPIAPAGSRFQMTPRAECHWRPTDLTGRIEPNADVAVHSRSTRDPAAPTTSR